MGGGGNNPDFWARIGKELLLQVVAFAVAAILVAILVPAIISWCAP